MEDISAAEFAAFAKRVTEITDPNEALTLVQTVYSEGRRVQAGKSEAAFGVLLRQILEVVKELAREHKAKAGGA